MKAMNLKNALATATLLTALGHAAMVSADTQTDSLGSGKAKTDYYQVNCFDDGNGAPQSLVLQIQDAPPVKGPKVSAQLRKGDSVTNTTDPIDGDGQHSPLVWVNGGAGIYDVFVDKTGKAPENYSLLFHCFSGSNGSGVHTGTAITTKQNQ